VALTERDTMTSASGNPNSVEATTTLLQAELPRLESHQQALEKELAAVTERLESVRSALTALQALSVAPHVLQAAEQAGQEDAAPRSGKAAARTPERKGAQEKAAEADTEAPASAGRKRDRKRPASTAKKSAAGRGDRTPAQEKAEHPSGLTQQVLDVLSAADGGTVRAREVAKELGRDGSPGDINAVRSTLDRLVATSRADRAGRGLYRSRS
jgi:hypothetical protein